MNATLETTIRDIVAEDFRAAAVFQRYGLDFCCGGARSVLDACREKGLDAAAVLTDLQATCGAEASGTPRFATWDIPTLINYIVGNHHAYVRRAIPTLLAYTEKIAAVHGERHPELGQIARLFAGVADEMTSHMFKEERILFPYIQSLHESVQQQRGVPPCPFGTVGNPIRMMEMEHESAGSAMARIRELSGGYEPPADACTTYRVSLEELKAFEDDLHAHVHLENNILFPRAIALEEGAA
jgi:regulator of cell morphogenesis and NO signaling